MTSNSPFTDLTTVEDRGGGTFGAAIDPMWTVGPKVHGGCMMALCAAAAHKLVGDTSLAPVALGANFLTAPNPGAVDLTATIRRRGRQISLVEVELSQDGCAAITCSVTLGSVDVNNPRHQEPLALADFPAAPPRDATPGHLLGAIIHFTQGCDLRMEPATTRFFEGHQGPPITRMWLRPAAGDEGRPETPALFAIMAADVSPPVTMHRGIFGWAPTVQLTTYLRRRPTPGWMRVIASSTVIGDSWFEEDHVVLDAAGHVIVQSRQLAMLPKATWQHT
jgi:acyl-coenzyme A thioesterase PaaI-like protein